MSSEWWRRVARGPFSASAAADGFEAEQTGGGEVQPLEGRRNAKVLWFHVGLQRRGEGPVTGTAGISRRNALSVDRVRAGGKRQSDRKEGT